MADTILGSLPNYLNLPPHLSAHKYFFVCTLTVAAWDTLVLSPRAWRLSKTPEWPPLKVLFTLLRFLMPAEFIIVAVAFFSTNFTLKMCDTFYLFEPITTMVLISLCSAVHLIRIHAIYDKSRPILMGLGALLLAQVAVMAVACAFFRVMPLKDQQGCIAGPVSNWVGIYWLAPTLFFTVTWGLALARSIQSLQVKPLGAWKLMLRDGLNLYTAIWLVNMINMLFWFIVTPTDAADTIKTTVTSMTAVLTTTMTLRIILSVRGSLAQGGSYAGVTTAGSASRTGTTHVLSTRSNGAAGPGAHTGSNVIHINSQVGRNPGTTYTLDEMRGKAEREWVDDGKSSYVDTKEALAADGRSVDSAPGAVPHGIAGVKVTIDREVDYTRQ